MESTEIELDYQPRLAFMPFHNRTDRWACLVAHRRAGKTVAAINDLIRAAALCASPMPLFAYIAPYRSQAKSVAWEYLKHYARPILASVNESDLYVDLVNGARIRLFGADNADAMRGLGFDGLFLDEYADFKPSVFGNILRPALSDKQGWCVFASTPKGKNQFWDIYSTAQRIPSEWFCLNLPASVSKLLPDGELAAAKAQLSPDQYMQEYECSFEAAILGAYYGVEMREATDDGRITRVPYDNNVPVHTAWDLGYRDDTAVWFYQVIRDEVHIVDFYSVSGANIDEIAANILARPYNFGKHHLPHDARAKTLAAAGKSVIEQLAVHFGINSLAIVPDLSVQDGIQAVRKVLPQCWFDTERCNEGIEALRQYQREYDEDKKAFRQTPRHDWCFTGDTTVLTRYGIQQIMNLQDNGEVLTSCGWKRYTNPRVTRKNAELVEVEFVGGYSVRCTPDHLFKTESGWISAENLTKNSQILSSLTQLHSISMAVYTGYGLVINTFRKAAKSCIGMFGGLHSALYLMVATYTTKIATQKTISYTILNACLPRYIYLRHGTHTQERDLVNLREMQQPLGINQKLAIYGISGTQRERSFGQRLKEKRSLVHNAACYLWRLSGSQLLCKNIVARLARLKHTGQGALIKRQLLGIESVKRLSQTEDVWCMSVPGIEEFSLGNGAIVHNCSHPADAFRMLAIAWRSEPRVRQPDAAKPLMVGEQNTATLNDVWAQANQPKRGRI